MKTSYTLFILFLPYLIFSQPLSLDSGETYAVVVGISDYQDEQIPDLRFADKDAEAFANFLRSPAGGRLDKDHLKVLINEQATAAQFAIALDWLWEVVKENDKVILYFSGHGDVERKSITQPGYLLCWDAPSRVYMAGGALALPIFQDVISTLSAQNKAKVIVITDACRSGKLSGSSISGAQITGANLAKVTANEIKILSCQADEYSIEGEQWGGGRGAFSYHLLDGLYGMADGNSDLNVNLKEIGRYLEDNVTEEVAPHPQNPMIVGDKTEKLTNVFPEILEELKAGKKGQMQLFTSTDSRGIEEEVLASIDTITRKIYFAFKRALEEKQFLEPVDACADDYYRILSKEPKMERLHSSMRRNYAAALQDDAQQVLNTMLKSGLTGWILKASKASDLYKNYPAYLQRAAELLGEQHYMYSILQARKYYFAGKIAAKRKEKRAFYKKALGQQANMPHALVELIQSSKADQLDSVTYYFQKAIDLVPSWVEPYIAAGNYYYKKMKQPEKMEEMLQLAGEVDSTSVLVWFQRAYFYNDQKDYQQAEKWYLKVIDGAGADICFPCVYNNLGMLYDKFQRYDEAEKQYKKAIQLDSTHSRVYNNLGNLYKDMRRYEEAEKQYQKDIQIDSTGWVPYANLGLLYQKNHRWEESETMAQKSIEYGPPIGALVAILGNAYTHLPNRMEEAKTKLDKGFAMSPNSADVHIYLALWYLKNNQKEQAWKYFEQGLEKGVGNEGLNLSDLQKDSSFEAMRKDPKWKELIQKYFPNENKK